MATALQVLTLKAMSRASGYGVWSQTRGKSALIRDHKVSDGSGWEWNTDTTPAKVRLYTHDPEQELGRQMMFASLPDYSLYEKGLKNCWYAWKPGEECMSQKFTASWVADIKNGGKKLMIGDSAMGCKFCRQEPLAETEKTPTQMTPETTFGTSATTTVSDATPFRDEIPLVTESMPPGKMVMGSSQEWSLEELRAELTKRQAEAEVTASALTEESRAAVGSTGAPIEPTELPSAQSQPTPPEATTVWPLECPQDECDYAPLLMKKGKRAGQPLSEKQRRNAVRLHMRSQQHTDTASAVPA